MKKTLLILILFFQLSVLHSMESNIGVGFGFLGVGYTAGSNISDGYVFGRLLNFTYQTKFGLGVTASPLMFFLNFQDSDNFSLTFVNVSLFYNFFKTGGEYIVLGPFVSARVVGHDDPGFFEFSSGLAFSLRNWDFSSFYEIESKFNLKNNKNGS